ncbi:hypothetical protein MARU1_002997 [Malassezia arunalokei]|uniref:Uncharacterized protein n=1 Tax=Malassezia arunalokei TaxID=1514897 RepID=A0AAJ5Z4Z3_9BASI|nr:hypothetical protein MARU1_002997 [Malassezia arunalokei]
MSMTNAVQDVSNKALGTEKGVENKVPHEVTDAVKQGASDVTSSEKEKPSTEQEHPNNVTSPVASDAKAAAAQSTQEPVVDAGERVTEHTTVYTEATPQVLESENHHVLTESVPITHTSIPDYNERATAAPPIVGSDLYSILRDSSQQRSMDYTKTQTGAPVASGAVASGVPSYLQNSSQVPASSTTAAEQAPTSLEQFAPTDEQAWSVRGPASTVQSRGPADVANSTGAKTVGAAAGAGTGGVASQVGQSGEAVQNTQNKLGEAVQNTQNKLGESAKDVGGKPGDALEGAKDKVGDVSKKPGDVAQQAESKAGDVKKQGTDAVDQAKKAGKTQKKGLLQKIKKALKIGKDYK